ncbi:MAG TPA: hypothetical protein VFJ14_17845 [Nocardioidaceae bacterium]|nr:hypothetical protein [Nocardioidaceae bacterium]
MASSTASIWLDRGDELTATADVAYPGAETLSVTISARNNAADAHLFINHITPDQLYRLGERLVELSELREAEIVAAS